MYLDMRARMAWFDPALKGKIVFPYWMQFFDYLITIKKVPKSWFSKLMCYLYMAYWLILNSKRMTKDLFDMLETGLFGHSSETFLDDNLWVYSSRSIIVACIQFDQRCDD